MSGSKAPVSITQSGDYPVTGDITLRVSLKKPARLRLLLRRPAWSKNFSVTVNGSPAETTLDKGYAVIDREWRDGDAVTVSLDMRGRVERLNGYDAIVRGPIVLARDKRFGDGDVDEVVTILDKDGYIDLKPVKAPEWAWMSFAVPAVVGVDRVEHAGAVDVGERRALPRVAPRGSHRARLHPLNALPRSLAAERPPQAGLNSARSAETTSGK